MSTDLHLPVADTSTGTTAAQVLAGLAGAAALPAVVLVGAPAGRTGVVVAGIAVALTTLAVGYLLGRLEVAGGATLAGLALVVAVPLLALAVTLAVVLTPVGPGTAALAAAAPVAVLASLVATLGVRTLVVVPEGSGFLSCVAWVGVAVVLGAAWTPLLLGQQLAAEHRATLTGQVEATQVTPYLPELEGYDAVDVRVEARTSTVDGTAVETEVVDLEYRSTAERSPGTTLGYVTVELQPLFLFDVCDALPGDGEDCSSGPGESKVVEDSGRTYVAVDREGTLLVATSDDVDGDTLAQALVDAPTLTASRLVRSACHDVAGDPGVTTCVAD